MKRGKNDKLQEPWQRKIHKTREKIGRKRTRIVEKKLGQTSIT